MEIPGKRFYDLTKVIKQFSVSAIDKVAPPGSLVFGRTPWSWTSRRSRLFPFLLLSLVGTFLSLSPLTMAQTAAGSSVGASKHPQKEQQKADRKARRAKKNAELKTLEKNGYQPGWGNNADTQQSLQSGPHKAGQKPGNATPASAP